MGVGSGWRCSNRQDVKFFEFEISLDQYTMQFFVVCSYTPN